MGKVYLNTGHSIGSPAIMALILPLRPHSRKGEALMDQFNSELACPGTVASSESLTLVEIATAIVPALIGITIIGFIAVLMLL